MSNFSAFLGIISSLCGIIGLIIAIINSKKIGKFGITMIVTILIAVIGAGVFFSTSTTIVPHPPTNPFVPNATTPSTKAEPTFTPTPSSPIHPNPPLTIPCIQGPCNLAGTVTLTSIDLDKANQKMTWHFHITSMADGTYGFSQLYLEDPSTMMYQAGGQVSDKWTKKSGDSTDESPTFGFYPQRATPYKLYLVLLVISSGGTGNYGVNYETETFTFNT
jgi:hypothetical protein